MYGVFGCVVGLCIIKLSLCLQTESVNDHRGYSFLPKNCGVSVFSATRIIGGQEASLGQYPWIVRLGYDVHNNGVLFYLCAGTIINRWHVITAKHCMNDELMSTISQVRVGENYPKEEKDCDGSVCAPPPQDIDIEFVRLPKANTSETTDKSYKSYADIALLKLSKPILFNDFVQPICLPTADMVNKMDEYLKIHEMVEIAGWGTIRPNRTKVPEKLMYIKLPIVEQKLCTETFVKNYIDESQICIGVGAGKDTCVGDSGGPVMKPLAVKGPPKYFLYGLVSYGTKTCGLKSAVYTNVIHYMKWILDNVRKIG